MPYQPLAYPDNEEELARLSHQHALIPGYLFLLLQLLGWSSAWQRRGQHFFAQMEARETPPNPGLWAPEERDVAQRLAAICTREAHWPRDHFIPEDPFGIMITAGVADLSEVEATMAIEDEFGVEFPGLDDREWEAAFGPHPESATMRDVVQWILRERASAQPTDAQPCPPSDPAATCPEPRRTTGSAT